MKIQHYIYISHNSDTSNASSEAIPDDDLKCESDGLRKNP